MSTPLRTATIGPALAGLRAGRAVLIDGVPDPGGRPGGTDLVLAAALAEPRAVASLIRRTGGFVVAAVSASRAEVLGLTTMTYRPDRPDGSAFLVAVDAASGVSTGISAADRARTGRVLADPASTPADLTRPGHVIPLRADDGGVLVSRGRAEAATDLCRLAGLPPVALLGYVGEGGPTGDELGVDVADIVDEVLQRHRPCHSCCAG